VEMAHLPAQLGVTHDFTAHDYYSYCPQISLTDHTDRYCGEKGLEQCRQCLRRNPAPGGEDIESWRARHAKLLTEARFVIAPSADVALRMSRFVPTANVQVVPHSKLETHAALQPRPMPRVLDPARPLKVVVLGALSKIKGADILEDVAILAARLKVPVEFHLLGYAYRNLRTQPRAALTVHGQYEDKDLPQLLQWLQPDLVWFPAVWPETYSYTLSASLDSGLPIVAPDIGAFSERLQHREWTWLCNSQQPIGAWVDFFTAIRETNFCTGVGPSVAAPASDLAPVTEQELDYHGGYLESLRPSGVRSAEDLVDLQDELTLLQQACRDSRPPSSALKLMALRVLLRMRSSRVFAPLVKSFPMHLQRKMKSYLGS
jgi:O-antigen biosynthesis protein